MPRNAQTAICGRSGDNRREPGFAFQHLARDVSDTGYGFEPPPGAAAEKPISADFLSQAHGIHRSLLPMQRLGESAAQAPPAAAWAELHHRACFVGYGFPEGQVDK